MHIVSVSDCKLRVFFYDFMLIISEVNPL